MTAAQIDISVVVPTYNEAENVAELIPRLLDLFADRRFEVVVVDDNSPDETWRIVEEFDDARVRVIRRLDARGLSSAILTGMQAAQGDVIGVIDADLQHDEQILPDLVDAVEAGADLAVGSRKAEGGGFGEWSTSRRFVSWTATKLARVVVAGSVTDPMSGYFVCSRSYLRSVEGSLNPRGFKILLELLARGEPEVAEVGYQFRNRVHGETKLTSSVIFDYLYALLQLRLGTIVSSTFVRYASVGFAGSLVNLTGYVICRLLGVAVLPSVIIGVEVSIAFNYLVNRRWTFPTGKGGELRGFFLYQTFSSHGLFVQAAVFQLLRGVPPFSSLSSGGMVLANACAIAVASIGNYAIHSNYTWRMLDQRGGLARSSS